LWIINPMAEQPPNVCLNLANTPENVVLVREMLSGVADAVDLSGSELNDIRTAVTEACNNVVLHAYHGGQGPLEVEVCIAESALVTVVRDHGYGIHPLAARPDSNTLGIGLHVIRTLAHQVEFTEVSEGGTEVRMEFATPSLRRLDPSPEDHDFPTLDLDESPTTTSVSITPVSLARTVLPRLVSVLAARAHFSTDRISDAQLLTDALVAHAPAALHGDHLSIGVRVEPRELELHLAPLGMGRGQQLLGDSDLEGLGRVIEKLADRRNVSKVGSYETLTLGLIDHR
jgi:serine/threonine-protein kinase RsbW